MHPDHGVASIELGSADQAIPTNADFLLIADTHASYPYAPHALKSNDDRIDHIVSAAIRPPEVDLWGDRILDWVLERPTQVHAVVHLGDAANIGCVSEFERFANKMQEFRDRTQVPWFMAPGNHDSLMMGNWGYASPGIEEETRWGRECGLARDLDKEQFLIHYLAAEHWAQRGGGYIRGNYRCFDVDTQDSSAQAIVCHYAGIPEKPGDQPPRWPNKRYTAYSWGSFILQSIALDDNKALILIDTTDYREHPHLERIGGVWGGFSNLQAELATTMASTQKSKTIVVGGHYPIDALDSDSQKALLPLLESAGVVSYLSAHTHDSATARWHHFEGTSTPRGFLELNIGSVVAWPMEYAYFTMTPADASTTFELSINRIPRQLLVECAQWDKPSYRVKNNVYTSYHGTYGYSSALRAMFSREMDTFAGLPDTFGEQESYIRPLSELVAVPSVRAQVVSYERCQAIFASEAEDLDGQDPPVAGKSVRFSHRIWAAFKAKYITPLEDPYAEDQLDLIGDGDATRNHVWTSTSVPRNNRLVTAPQTSRAH
jgi:hypothetical protein